jgi:NAD(P)-dependent dehydrogenase (short-subunit alcohol dehydrogenase family)
MRPSGQGWAKRYRAAAALLANRTVLITGAGAGIGRTVARAFAAYGATVVLLGRTIPTLETLYDEIVAAGHPQPALYPLDLAGAQPADYDDLADRLETEFGRLDGLLHNAAELGTLSPIEHYPVDTWARVIHVNLHASFVLTRACLPVLKRSPDASIVFTSDALGKRARAYWGAYAASKFAIEGLMQTLADELEPSPAIRVNSLDPGPVRSRLRAHAYPAEDPRRLLSAEEIVGAYLYLMGPDSRGVSGQTFAAQATLPPGVVIPFES